MSTVTADKIARLSAMLDGGPRVCVLSHTNPDGDAAGSSTAVRRYLASRGIEATVVLPGELAGNLKFIVDPECTVYASSEPGKAEALVTGCDLLICTDFNKPSRVDSLEGALRRSPARKVLIDHHQEPDTELFDLWFSETEISSASELVYQVLRALEASHPDGGPLTEPCARALMCGMTTDTNNFANSVYPSTLAMASDLLSLGVDRDAIIEAIYNSGRENRLRITGYILSEKLHIEGDTAWMILRREEIEHFGIREGELEGLVNIPLTVKEVTASIFLREDEGGYFRVSIRSKKGRSALAIAKTWYGGGGHEQAAGGKLRWPSQISSPEGAEAYVKEHLSE